MELTEPSILSSSQWNVLSHLALHPTQSFSKQLLMQILKDETTETANAIQWLGDHGFISWSFESLDLVEKRDDMRSPVRQRRWNQINPLGQRLYKVVRKARNMKEPPLRISFTPTRMNIIRAAFDAGPDMPVRLPLPRRKSSEDEAALIDAAEAKALVSARWLKDTRARTGYPSVVLREKAWRSAEMLLIGERHYRRRPHPGVRRGAAQDFPRLVVPPQPDGSNGNQDANSRDSSLLTERLLSILDFLVEYKGDYHGLAIMSASTGQAYDNVRRAAATLAKRGLAESQKEHGSKRKLFRATDLGITAQHIQHQVLGMGPNRPLLLKPHGMTPARLIRATHDADGRAVTLPLGDSQTALRHEIASANYLLRQRWLEPVMSDDGKEVAAIKMPQTVRPSAELLMTYFPSC